jgi:predicted transposase YbfD/YdcC
MKEELGFLDYFAALEDPRIRNNKLYTADELLFLTLLAVICGAEGWSDVEEFGKAKLDFLRGYLPYARGIPSDDTLRRFFRAIDPGKFQECFILWIESLEIPVDKGVIAIDGKTSRRSFDKNKNPLHLVSAFASEARIILGQIATEEKSNEITAIPKLLDMLDIRGATVSIDAMGCQKSIAQKIKEGGGEYILGLKGNQGGIHGDVKLFFADPELTKECVHYEETDGGHGRIETRKCFVTGETIRLYRLAERTPRLAKLEIHCKN